MKHLLGAILIINALALVFATTYPDQKYRLWQKYWIAVLGILFCVFVGGSIFGGLYLIFG